MFFKVISVLNKLNFSNLRLFLIGISFVALAILDLIGLSLLAPYMQSLIELSIPETVSFMLQAVTKKRFSYSETMVVMSIAIIILYIMKSFFSLYVLRTIFSMSETVQANLKLLLTGHALTIKYVDFTRRNSASFQYNINMVASAFSQKVVLVSLRLLSDGLILSAVILFFAFYDLQIFLFMCAVTVISFIVIRGALTKKITQQGKLTNDYNKKIVQSVNESLDGLKEIKASGNEAIIYNNIAFYAKRYANLASKYQWLTSLPRYCLELLFIIVFITGVLMVGAEGFIEKIPSIAVLAFALIRLIPVLSNVMNSIMQITFGIEAFKLIMDDIDAVSNDTNFKRDFESQREKQIVNNQNTQFEGLELQCVSLKHETADTYVFRNVNLKVFKGSFVAITGASGTGKTSLLDVVAGLIKPSSGDILVNGDKNLLGSNWWKGKISYLPQDPFLFDASIRFNIVLDDHKIDQERLAWAIHTAQLETFVQQQKNGLDTYVGDRGKRISGGQKQRIALARALYSESEVLLLDEATSALDIDTETRVLLNLSDLKGEKTVISISHSQNSLQFYDSHLILSPTGVIQK